MDMHIAYIVRSLYCCHLKNGAKGGFFWCSAVMGFDAVLTTVCVKVPDKLFFKQTHDPDMTLCTSSKPLSVEHRTTRNVKSLDENC